MFISIHLPRSLYKSEENSATTDNMPLRSQNNTRYCCKTNTNEMSKHTGFILRLTVQSNILILFKGKCTIGQAIHKFACPDSQCLNPNQRRARPRARGYGLSVLGCHNRRPACMARAAECASDGSDAPSLRPSLAWQTFSLQRASSLYSLISVWASSKVIRQNGTGCTLTSSRSTEYGHTGQ